MAKLLRADLARMWKSRSFWVCCALSAVSSIINCFFTLRQGNWAYRTADLFADGCSNIVLFAAIFAALFIGTDYSNGTIRNKLTIGSVRSNIYLSDLTAITAGGLLIAAAKWIPCAVMACFGKEFGMGMGEFAFLMFIVILDVVVMSAVFTLLGMLITSKSSNTAITITSVFVMIVGAAVIMSLLMSPEYITEYEMTENGIAKTDPKPNPAYIGGAARYILTTVNDVLPCGQLMQLEASEPENTGIMPLYSLGVLAVTTAAGVSVFRRKDLK